MARRSRGYLAGGILVARDGGDPIAEALKHDFAGAELTVKVDAGWQLAHGERSLARIALEPLTQRAQQDPQRRQPFQLLLRLDTANVAAQPALESLLDEHAHLLTKCVADEVTHGAVTVVLTGPGWDRDRVGAAYERRAFLEGHIDTPGGPPSLVPLVFESLSARLGWDARDPWRELPGEARHIVRSLVLQARVEGRRLRFVDVPEEPRGVRVAMWRELSVAGVDYLSSMYAASLARFLRGQRRPRRHAAPRSSYNKTARTSAT
jgi:hypothetical protein